MTRKQFVEMIGHAESENKPKTIGDGGLAAGVYQQHWAWRLDYWPDFAWQTLALLDKYALEQFCVHDSRGFPRPPIKARALADLYNAGHPAPDPKYDARCQKALAEMGLPLSLLDSIVE